MAALGQLDHDVEAKQNEGGGGVTILPDDDYQLEIFESEVKPSGTGKGQNADFKVRVLDGPHKDTWFFAGITSIQHESAQAQAIGQGQLKSLCLSCDFDFTQLTDTEQLHFRPFFGRVRSETYFSKKHNKNLTKNVIKAFLYEGMPEVSDAPSPPADKAPVQPAPPAPAQAAAAGGRSWQKRPGG